MSIRGRLGKVARVTLAPLGLTISRVEPSEPDFRPIKIFDLCAHDLVRRIQRPFVLQIGANDGVRFDPIRPFIEEHGWSGLMVEPNPAAYADLVRNYRKFPSIKTANVAVGQSNGTLDLYLPSDEVLSVNPDLSGLCSPRKETLINTMAFQKISNPSEHIRKFTMRSLSVASLLKDHDIRSIDILQIDTEGYDWKILSQFDLEKLGVTLINMEYCHLTLEERSACIIFLNRYGFDISHYHLDLVAYRKSGW